MLRIGDVARLPGTRIQNRCVVTSTGVDALDGLMGGGLPISSLYVVSECKSRKYAPILVKYFVAEGVQQKQDVFVGGADWDPEFLTELPSCSTSSDVEKDVKTEPKENMKIAWRYATMPAMNSGLSAKDKTRFDLRNTLDISKLDLEQFNATSYQKLWDKLREMLGREEYLTQNGKKLLRILLLNIGSPLFEDTCNLVSFLSQLKLLLLQSNAVVMLSVQDDIFPDVEKDLLTTVSDAYFRLETHEENVKRDLALEDSYDGRFHIVKLPQLNSFSTNKPDCVDLVFERHRHYFEVKVLHLPAVMGGADAPKSKCHTVSEEF